MRERAARPRRSLRSSAQGAPESLDEDSDAAANEAELARRMLELES